MSISYRIGVVPTERSVWVEQLAEEIPRELARLGIHKSVAVELDDNPAPKNGAVAIGVVLLGPSPPTAELTSRVDSLSSTGLLVIPVVESLSRFGAEAPECLSDRNAFEWSGDEPALRLTRVLFEELGIEEGQRRVFISHRRSDGLAAAEQLHDALTHVRFDPFIDRFAIRPGESVQERIADALEQFAFILLLETPEAHESDWVFDEVDYALSHTMGIAIVCWPDRPTPVPGSHGLPRLHLDPSEVITDAHGYDVLTDPGLDRVIEMVEAAHAAGLARRRKMLLANVEDAIAEAGGESIAMKHWILDVSAGTERTLVSVVPRLPRSTDLERIDLARNSVDPAAGAVLVHAARRITSAYRAHLDWVCGGRAIELLPENAVGARW